MNTFVENFENFNETRTENGMLAYATSMSKCLDFFYKVAASRGRNVTPMFAAAFGENPELALRTLLWSRDVRGGAGERTIFREILKFLINTGKEKEAISLLRKIPEVGRWDDILVPVKMALNQPSDSIPGRVASEAVKMIREALENKQGLCAKWMPRKGPVAVALTNELGLTPKQYRKTLVNLTKVVETQMCAGDWDNINFSHVPSRASTIYSKAFMKRAAAKYMAWKNRLQAGTEKVNANAVYPYEVIRFLRTEPVVGQAMWDSLPDYMDGSNILPVCDVSGSMSFLIPGSKTSALDVCLSMGLYMADKNKGAFKDIFCTFSSKPKFKKLTGNLTSKLFQLERDDSWEMNTNLDAVFEVLLEHSIKNRVKPEDMPKKIVIFSDMQFDRCANLTAIEMIKKRYEESGYETPTVVFWNLAQRGTDIPAKKNEEGVVLVSGFSPSILKNIILSNRGVTPEQLFLDVVMSDRYSIQ